jgi:hypothetical protein
MMVKKRMVPVFMVALVALLFGAAAPEGWAAKFEDAEIFFEFNSTDNDLGIQIFFDGKPWKWVRVIAPDGRTIFFVKNRQNLREIGSTEAFTESAEPELGEDLSFGQFKRLFPAGVYRFSGETLKGNKLSGRARLTHKLPAAVELNLTAYPTITWTDMSGPGDPEIVRYQAIVELVVEASDEEVFEFVVDLSSNAGGVTVPDAFLDLVDEFDPGDIEDYKVEVIAIEKSGNKTITEEEVP